MNFKQQQSALRCGLVMAIVLPVLLTALKTMQLLLFYDQTTGMLQRAPEVTAMNLIVAGGLAALALFEVWMALLIHRVRPYFRLGAPPILGIGLFAVGVLFLGQAAADLLFILENRRLRIGGVTGDINILQAVLSSFGLLTAILLIMMAYSIIAGGKRPSPFFSIVPMIWCILFTLQLLFTYENLVSMQNNVVKTGISVLALIFLQDMVRNFSGMDGLRETKLDIFVRVVFPGVGMVGTLPYCIAYLFGVRDQVGNMPYLALAGLSLLAGICLIQLCVGAMYGLQVKQRKRKRGRLPPAVPKKSNPKETP